MSKFLISIKDQFNFLNRDKSITEKQENNPAFKYVQRQYTNQMEHRNM